MVANCSSLYRKDLRVPRSSTLDRIRWEATPTRAGNVCGCRKMTPMTPVTSTTPETPPPNRHARSSLFPHHCLFTYCPFTYCLFLSLSFIHIVSIHHRIVLVLVPPHPFTICQSLYGPICWLVDSGKNSTARHTIKKGKGRKKEGKRRGKERRRGGKKKLN